MITVIYKCLKCGCYYEKQYKHRINVLPAIQCEFRQIMQGWINRSKLLRCNGIAERIDFKPANESEMTVHTMNTNPNQRSRT